MISQLQFNFSITLEVIFKWGSIFCSIFGIPFQNFGKSKSGKFKNFFLYITTQYVFELVSKRKERVVKNNY